MTPVLRDSLVARVGAPTEGHAHADERLEVLGAAAGGAVLAGRVGAEVEAEGDPAGQEQLEAAAVVQRRVEVVAEASARLDERAVADEHEGGEAVGQLGDEVAARRHHGCGRVGDRRPRRHHRRLELDAEGGQRVVGAAQAELGAGAAQRLVGDARAVELVVAGEEGAGVEAELGEAGARAVAQEPALAAGGRRGGAAGRRAGDDHAERQGGDRHLTHRWQCHRVALIVPVGRSAPTQAWLVVVA